VDARPSDGTTPSAEPPRTEQLVAVRPDVLGDAEHALGNLFQRVYHVTRLTREGLGAHADRLTEALENIEQLLELVFDYVSPVEIELRPIGAAKALESLVAQLRHHRGAAALSTGECPALRVLVDPRALGRSFQLLARALGRDWERAEEMALEVTHDEEGERIQFSVLASVGEGALTTADANLAFAVAGRLIDLQGGDLQAAMSEGKFVCSITLPISTENNGAA
jgi:hypothetical protein